MMTPHDVAHLLRAFAEPILLEGIVRHVVWGDPFSEVPTEASSLASRDASFWAPSDLAATILRGDAVERDGVAYRVSHKEPDEDGRAVRVVLERDVE